MTTAAYASPDLAVRELRSRRTRAGWVDVALLAVVAIVIAAIGGTSPVYDHTTHPSPGVTDHFIQFRIDLHGWPALVSIGIWLMYSFVLEAAWGGRTVGKALLGLRVVTLDGGPAGPGRILVRTVLRIVDVLPCFYLLGYIAMSNSGEPPQRVGDYVAGTTVAYAAGAPPAAPDGGAGRSRRRQARTPW